MRQVKRCLLTCCRRSSDDSDESDDDDSDDDGRISVMKIFSDTFLYMNKKKNRYKRKKEIENTRK